MEEKYDYQLDPVRNTVQNNAVYWSGKNEREEAKRGDSITVEQSLFQETDGGSIPTSPHQFKLEVIDKNRASGCYDKWHYLGSQGFISTVDFGVTTNGYLWGCISFGSPNAKVLKGYWTPETQEGWFEIKRLALSDSLPKNSESHTIAVAIRLLRKMFDVKGIVTYADSGVGHVGTIYKASGFKYLGLTALKSDFFEEGATKPVQRGEVKHLTGEWRERTQKHLFIKSFAPN